MSSGIRCKNLSYSGIEQSDMNVFYNTCIIMDDDSHLTCLQKVTAGHNDVFTKCYTSINADVSTVISVCSVNDHQLQQ